MRRQGVGMHSQSQRTAGVGRFNLPLRAIGTLVDCQKDLEFMRFEIWWAISLSQLAGSVKRKHSVLAAFWGAVVIIFGEVEKEI